MRLFNALFLFAIFFYFAFVGYLDYNICLQIKNTGKIVSVYFEKIVYSFDDNSYAILKYKDLTYSYKLNFPINRDLIGKQMKMYFIQKDNYVRFIRLEEPLDSDLYFIYGFFLTGVILFILCMVYMT